MTDEKFSSSLIGILDGENTVNQEQPKNNDSLVSETLNLYQSGSYPLDIMKKFMASLDTTTLTGTAALDEAVKACSNFNTAQDVIDQMIADIKSSSSATDFLQNKCGIILSNADTGAITGSDAGGAKSKNAADIVPESGESEYPEDTTFTIRGLTVTVPDKSTLTTDQQTIVKGLYSWWIDECMNLIEESYGYSFTDEDATVTSINVSFGRSNLLSSSTLAAVQYFYDPNAGKTGNLVLHINTDAFF